MPELRKDPIVGRWVIIADERAKRPHDFKSEAPPPDPGDVCPFCEGHEDKRRPKSSPTATSARDPTARAGESGSFPTGSPHSRSKET